MPTQQQINDAHRHQPWYVEALEEFPKPGAKLRYRGAEATLLRNIAENAERELQAGEIYTLRTIELFSSWACVTLEETGETKFALVFFDSMVIPGILLPVETKPVGGTCL